MQYPCAVNISVITTRYKRRSRMTQLLGVMFVKNAIACEGMNQTACSGRGMSQLFNQPRELLTKTSLRYKFTLKTCARLVCKYVAEP